MKISLLHLLISVLIIFASFSTASAWSWTMPQLVSEVSSPYGESVSCISSDSLTLYFTRGNTADHYWNQLYQATRSSVTNPFSNVTIINELACNEHETNSWVLENSLDMYFARTWQIRESTRATTTSPWGAPQNLTSINNTGPVANPKVSNDELSIVFNVFPDQSTAYLYTANRSDSSLAFSNIRALSELDTGVSTWASFLSPNGLTLYFNRNDSGIWNNYMSTRPSITGTFGTPQLLEYWPEGYRLGCFSTDGKSAYLNFNGDIYISQIPGPSSLILVMLGLGGLLFKKHI